jgi:ATP-binding protein involved in chromosome partitioning
MQPQPASQKFSMPQVKYVVAVASGKGGVGKSTVAANLALALHMHGQRVGLMDADIYGPSVPIMMGLGVVDQTKTPFPIVKYGLKLMSMGFLVDPAQAVIWRGPKVAQAVNAFLTQIDWGELDFLIIDLPPGTGDAQLTLTQTAPLTGAIVVTTPQDVSLIDARKGVKMFYEVRVPVLGVVENMSYFIGDDGKRYDLFRSGGGRKLAEESGVPLLGELPIDPRVAECGDAGEPIVSRYPDSPVAQAYLRLATAVAQASQEQAGRQLLPEVQL